MRKRVGQRDLAGLHRHCEVNYHRLCRLLQGREYGEVLLEEPDFHQVRVKLELEAQSRYTEILHFIRVGEGTPWLPRLKITARVYHDARMVEVIECQGQRVPLFRLRYPNRFMYQGDEKLQINLFFGECLSQCLELGQNVDPLPLPV